MTKSNPPTHMHRSGKPMPQGKRTSIGQAASLNHRKAKITLKKKPWEDEE